MPNIGFELMNGRFLKLLPVLTRNGTLSTQTAWTAVPIRT